MDSLLESSHSCVTQNDLTYSKSHSTSSPAMKWMLCHYMPAMASSLDHHIIANNHLLNSSCKRLTQRESYFWDLITLILKVCTEKGWTALLLELALLEVTEYSFLKMILRPLRNMVAWMCKYVCVWVLGAKEITKKKKRNIQLILSLSPKENHFTNIKMFLPLRNSIWIQKHRPSPLEVYKTN